MSQLPDRPKPEPIQLDYAPDPRGRRWRKRITRAIVGLVLLAVAWVGYDNRDEISLRVRRWYWARQCLAHVTPAGTVLLEYDRNKVAGSPDYVIDADPSLFTTASFGSLRPTPLPRLPNPPAGYMPRVWREFARLDPRSGSFKPMPRSPSPIIFLGERRTPAGKRRLVALAGGTVNALEFEISISRLVLPVPGLLEKVTQPARTGIVSHWHSSSRHVHAILQPGIADPGDPTRIIIDFETQIQSTEKPARKGTLDVYLKDDDTLEFKLRDPSILRGLP